MPPLFEDRATATIARVTSTFGQRGSEYGDTLRNCQWITMKAVASKFCLHINPRLMRAIALAALVDVKYQRGEGGYKDDNIVDGVAYQLVLAEEIRQLDLELLHHDEAPQG